MPLAILMKYIYHLLIISFLSYTQTFGQEGFNIQIGLGYSFQNETTPAKLDFYDTNTIGIRLGGTYQKTLINKLVLELGLIGKYNRGSRETELVNFISHNFRVQLPIYVGVKPLSKFIIRSGIGIENNRDLKDLDFSRKDHNLRLDLLIKINYLYSKRLSFYVYSNWSLNNTPGVYTINSPDNGVYLGIAYLFK